eukprot:gnl/Spiro4/13042_TR6916_c0_g1_i1.p1 gnl/Spiro4/13042_TR6916_c0_g1~~gnl/Spiro4/13042_TR6916_c0_g1_i1.p1  ORF type:complete len:198 (+),score=46.40 gnl/Spiro4/13042_TR6916_c0_g1_i1:75-668(+)
MANVLHHNPSLEQPIVTYSRHTSQQNSQVGFIETQSGNKINRCSILCGSNNIHLHGKTIIHAGTIVRGDLALIKIGKNCIIGEQTILHPGFRRLTSIIAYVPLTIGEHVMIGQNCMISAAIIGSYVHIGDNCVISKRCVLKDCCRIKPGTVLPPDTVVPPFCVYGGFPGQYIRELPESTQLVHKEVTTTAYQRFVPT